jgi:glyoxylase-like metal-dependent hydrolase (beta-lactamase superfamily II)
MGMFSDTGEYDGKPGSLVDPCFVIRHPKGTLLWDAGLGDKIADSATGLTYGGVQGWVDHKLADQLKMLGLTPADITFLALSHLHFDHTGNANAFPSARAGSYAGFSNARERGSFAQYDRLQRVSARNQPISNHS